jgi:hypothetical protein
MAEEEHLSGEQVFTREDIASARPSSKEEYERILEWWENYDPGMDADLLSRARSSSLHPLLGPRRPQGFALVTRGTILVLSLYL